MEPIRKITDATESMDAFTGRRVFHLMWDRKVTQTAIAARLGIQQPALSKKLRGDRGWSLDDLKTVAAALDTTIAYLVGETEEASPQGPDQIDLDYKGVITRLDDYRNKRSA